MKLAAAGDLRLAGHLAELAAQAAPDDKGVHAVRAEVFGAAPSEEASTMSKGIFSWAEHESQGSARHVSGKLGRSRGVRSGEQ